MSRDEDRGMRAVARVRAVRERDSRIGLLQALTTVRLREEELGTLRATLEEAARRVEGDLDDFAASRRLLTGMAAMVREAEHRLEGSRTVAAEAHVRWQADKARVRAIEQLLDHRAERRAEDEARADVREIEDIVGRLWSRTGVST